MIAIVPFPTALLGEFGYVVPTFSYALTMLLAGLLSAAIWWYASGGAGVSWPGPPAELRRSHLRALIAPGIFLGSIGLAVVDSGVARLSWFLIGLVALIRPAERCSASCQRPWRAKSAARSPCKLPHLEIICLRVQRSCQLQLVRCFSHAALPQQALERVALCQ